MFEVVIATSSLTAYTLEVSSLSTCYFIALTISFTFYALQWTEMKTDYSNYISDSLTDRTKWQLTHLVCSELTFLTKIMYAFSISLMFGMSSISLIILDFDHPNYISWILQIFSP